jgi:hypothetical protein
MNTSPTQIIICPENPDQVTTVKMMLNVDKFNYKEGISRYRGQESTVFLTSVDSQQQIEQIKNLAREFNQPSLVEIKQGHSWLIELAGNEIYLGPVIKSKTLENIYAQIGSKLLTFKRG